MLAEQHESPPGSSGHVSTLASRSRRLVVRGLFNLAVIIAFTYAVAGAIWLFYHGYPWLIAGMTLTLFMIVAFCSGRSLRERIVLSLCVPFLALGGYIGFQIYFAMFTVSWFNAVFNSKDIGPLGEIVFVCGFAVVTASVAGWSMHRLSFRVWHSVGKPPQKTS
jgi:hypothetical protein